MFLTSEPEIVIFQRIGIPEIAILADQPFMLDRVAFMIEPIDKYKRADERAMFFQCLQRIGRAGWIHGTTLPVNR